LKLSVKSHWISRLPSLSPLRIFPSKRQVARKPIRHPLVKAISRDDSDGVTWLRPDHVVTAAGRPVLVVPYAGTFACVRSRVLVVWDGTHEANRALHDALPLIGDALRRAFPGSATNGISMRSCSKLLG
jgi:hypothetical protein